MNKEIVSTPNAPAAIGPYSQAVKTGLVVFLSGPASGFMEVVAFERGEALGVGLGPVGRGVEAGNLSVNSHSSVRYSTPFGGYKQSGLGRELGPDALDAFTETKNIFISAT